MPNLEQERLLAVPSSPFGKQWPLAEHARADKQTAIGAACEREKRKKGLLVEVFSVVKKPKTARSGHSGGSASRGQERQPSLRSCPTLTSD